MNDNEIPNFLFFYFYFY